MHPAALRSASSSVRADAGSDSGTLEVPMPPMSRAWEVGRQSLREAQPPRAGAQPPRQGAGRAAASGSPHLEALVRFVALQGGQASERKSAALEEAIRLVTQAESLAARVEALEGRLDASLRDDIASRSRLAALEARLRVFEGREAMPTPRRSRSYPPSGAT